MKSLSRAIGIPRLALSVIAVLLVFASFGFATGVFFGHPSFKLSVDPELFDPSRTKLVAAQWIGGIGCPTGAKQRLFDLITFILQPPSTFTDAACPTGDLWDRGNEGLLFVKTAESNNNAAATATIQGVRGIILSEIGYDIRAASHCGAGAPRFNITTKPTVAFPAGKFYFLGCTSPPPTSTPFASQAWSRLRWGNGTPGSVPAYLDGVTLENITDPIKSISMIFDEAQYNFVTDFSGLAVLDNIDVNGKLVGRDNDKDHRFFHHDW